MDSGWIVSNWYQHNWPRNSEKYSIIIRHSTVHPHCTSNISEQWHYCTVCALSWWGDQQQCYPDCSPWWAVLDWYHRLIVLYCWYRYWSSCQCEVHSSIQCCTVGSSSNCWCTQWSLLYSDCDEQQHWSSDCQCHYHQHQLYTTSSPAMSVLHS